MTNAEIIAKVSAWQAAGFVHELTCGTDSRHASLVAKEIEGKVVLVCPTCDYMQQWIPEVCLSGALEDQRAGLKRLGIIPAILCALLLSSCTFDCHIDCDLSAFMPKPKPKAVKPAPVDPNPYERIDAYLSSDGLTQARDHGWLIMSMEARAHGIFYHLRRPLIAESAPVPAEKP